MIKAALLPIHDAPSWKISQNWQLSDTSELAGVRYWKIFVWFRGNLLSRKTEIHQKIDSISDCLKYHVNRPTPFVFWSILKAVVLILGPGVHMRGHDILGYIAHPKHQKVTRRGPRKYVHKWRVWTPIVIVLHYQKSVKSTIFIVVGLKTNL